jgi:hypothetical protein
MEILRLAQNDIRGSVIRGRPEFVGKSTELAPRIQDDHE